ncbi:MAG TPA: type IV secretion system DNA-binding domain-containing protein [Candidatus Paceibacterota bacterium]
MQEDPNKVVYFAETDSRNRRTRFGIKTKDRSRHMYVIGKTGMGKSTLLENLAIQDIQEHRGCIFIDPHGKTADLLLEYVPEDRINDVLYFAPFDLDYPISFNVMEDVGADKRHLVANGLMSAFKKIWVDAWSARMEYILNNILLALLEYPDSTLIGVNRMLADEGYRNKVVEYITDPSVKAFWVDEFAKYGPRYMQEAGAAIQNKIGQFISNPLVRNIIGQPKSTFDIRKMMDDKKILIINLSKGRVGEANANLLGAMLITKIYLGAMSRADLSESELEKLPHSYLYVDEFQNFANESFADILSEARKYRLNLIVAHQYIEQMTDEVRAAVFGNVGTMAVFRVGAYDAEVLEKEYMPQFTAEDLVNLGFAQIYLKLMIDGVTSKPFSATTLPPIARLPETFREKIINSSRKTFARSRVDVENEIRAWHEEAQATTGTKIQDARPAKLRSNPSPIDQALAAVLGKPVPPSPRINNSYQPNVVPMQNTNREQNTGGQFSRNADRQNPDRRRDPAYDRERDLRKAVSLSYLRQTRKKEKKAPSDEHLADLRSALASITADINESGEPVSQPSPVQKQTPPIKETILKQEPISKESSNASEKVSHTEKTEYKKDVKEVPEEILKKILEIQ